MSQLDQKQAPQTPNPGVQSQAVVKFVKEQPAVDTTMTTLFGGGYGQYQVRPENFALSVVTHTFVIGLMLWIFHVTLQPKILPQVAPHAVVELTDY
ncbi:MAG TPA: hypothetical protein VFL42_10345, partial [Terriglobales bacterium]|nr:hypothetical protein [Terriglobales bacterium]